MCCKYLAMSDLSTSNLNRERVQDILVDCSPKSDEQVGIAFGVETAIKKKKKRGNERSSDAIACQSEVDKSANSKKSEDQVFHEAPKAPAGGIMDGSQLDEYAKKEEKKKKKGKLDSESHVDNVECYPSELLDGKGSKKRKRLDSEVHDSRPFVENAIEDTKRRKTESSEEQCTKLNSLVGADKHENENIEKNGKNSEQKSLKKQQNGSVQPKKPFQRVNIDDIVFVDSRLEDNSYWGKDGAESGYGAKAQEVLGQVRGRYVYIWSYVNVWARMNAEVTVLLSNSNYIISYLDSSVNTLQE
ncbi:hypothetical protein CRYUN_Cryun25bG0042400 [Craigia yunnanensis]